jgi:cobalamin biosynthesis Mg chelatase CobN
MPLKRSTKHSLISTGTALISVPIMAHSGHFENKEQKTEANTKSKPNIEEKPLSSEQDQSTSNQNQPTETETQLKEEQSATQYQQTESYEAQSATQNQTVTIAKMPTLGETLLGLIIVTPCLLYALKKRIHRYG